MKANELRLGNYVCRLNRQNILKVCSIDSSGSIYFDGLDGHHFDLNEGQRIEPIPITPEILEKCGFESGDPALIENSDGDCFYLSDTKVKFVHQLQNLYFALTGEELKVNL